MTPARPMLAGVLAVLTDYGADAAHWRELMSECPVAVEGDGVSVSRDADRWEAYAEWAHRDPADAVAALVETGLVAEHWSDEGRAPRWWCLGCGDSRGAGCWRCDGSHSTAAPPSHSALVAVTAIGVDTLARAEAIVAETWRARVVWRVTERLPPIGRPWPQRGTVAEVVARVEMGAPDEDFAVVSLPSARAVRALLPLGLRLLAVADGRVTLGVEAL